MCSGFRSTARKPGETSTRTVGNYLRGRLPDVIDAPMNFVDVEDVAAGHLLAADRGAAGERYILGGVNLRWPHLIDRVAKLSGVRYPIIVLPRAIRARGPGSRGARAARRDLR